jgi:hypothetical protein
MTGYLGLVSGVRQPAQAVYDESGDCLVCAIWQCDAEC